MTDKHQQLIQLLVDHSMDVVDHFFDRMTSFVALTIILTVLARLAWLWLDKNKWILAMEK